MLDEKDTEIIEQLRKNSRESTALISRKTGIPRVTVHERIRKLVEKGIIRRFTVLPDYKKMGLPTTAFVLVSYTPHSKMTQVELAEKIAKLPNVFEVHVLAGEWDLILKTRAESIEAIGRLVVNRLRELEGVGKTLTIACFETAKDEP
jgi:Lrp/AsnC family leucine-responsive transcriptional regulator